MIDDPHARDTPPDAIVVGASGAVGRFLLRRLAAQGARVLALSRRAAPAWSIGFAGLRWHRGGLPDTDLALLPAARRLYSAGPLDAFAEACARGLPPGVESVVALSSLSAVWKAASRNPAERALAERLVDAETRLRATLSARGVSCALLRPGLLYGAGVDHSLTPLRRAAARWGFLPWPDCARGRRAPVHVDDVAAAMLAAAARAPDATLALAGSTPLPFDEVVDRVLATLAPRVRRWTLPVPRGLAVRLAPLPGRIGRMASVLDRAAADQWVDPLDWSRLGIVPRPFDPKAEDFTAWPE